LVWDPPARWRLEVTEAYRITSATVVGDRSVVCVQANGRDERCRLWLSSDRPVQALPFHELVAGVGSVLHELGIDPLGPVTVTHRLVGNAAADCFERASDGSSAEWCFGSGGTLLALELRAEDRARHSSKSSASRPTSDGLGVRHDDLLVRRPGLLPLPRRMFAGGVGSVLI